MRLGLGAAGPVGGGGAERDGERITADGAARSALRSELLAQLRAARENGVKLEPEASHDQTVRGWLELGAMAGTGRRAAPSGRAEAPERGARFPRPPAPHVADG